jgi:ATP-dependent RNA helicase DeaD
VAARRRAAFREDVLQILDAGQLDTFLALVEDLAGSHDPTELAAAAFKMAAQARDASRPGRTSTWLSAIVSPQAQGMETEEAREDEPLRARRGGPSDGVEGADESPRLRRPRASARASSGSMVRLFLRVGRRDGVRPADLVGAIANEAGLPGDLIGDIDLYDTFSFVEVPEDSGDKVINALNATTIRGRDPRATIALPEGHPDSVGLPFDQQRRYRAPLEDDRHVLRAPYAKRRPTAAGRMGASGSVSLGRPYRGKPKPHAKEDRAPWRKNTSGDR